MNKKILSAVSALLAAVLILFSSLPALAYASVDDIIGRELVSGLNVDLGSHGAVVVDMDTMTLLYARNANEETRPASLTKMMTLLVAYEHTRERQQEKVTVTKDMIDVPDGSSSANLTVGDQITLRDLYYAMMLPSGNDAAKTLAVTVAGSEEAFVELMNEKAAALNMEHTHFENSHGFDAPTHMTTPYDLSLLCCALCSEPELVEVCGTFKHTATVVTAEGEKNVTYYHRQDMLNPNSSKYMEGVKGIKTGYTSAAGNCLTTYYEKDGRRLVVVVTNAPTGKTFDDTHQLIDKVLATYATIDLSKVLTARTFVVDVKDASLSDDANGQLELYLNTVRESKYVTLPVKLADALAKFDESVITVRRPVVTAPVRVGDTVGTVEYLYKNEVIYEVPAVASRSVDAEVETPADLVSLGIKGKKPLNLSFLSSGTFWLVVAIIVGAAVLAYLLITFRRKQRLRVRMRQQELARRSHYRSSGRPGSRPR